MRLKIILLLTVASTLLLGSCKLGHKYVRPKMALPENLGAMVVTDTFSIADLDWWNIYTDTILQNLIKQTVEHNKDLRIADARIKELAARKRIEFANLFPEINGSFYTQKEGLDYGGHNFKNDPEYGLKAIVSWELDIWGNKRWANDRGKAEFMAGVEDRRALIMSLVADVARSYYEIVALDHELAIVKQTLEARKESVRIAKLRFEGGLTSETAFQQARVEYARTATRVPILERDIAMKENEISFIAGEFPTDIKRSSRIDMNLPEELPVGIPSTLLERRPDIRAAEQNLIAANAAMGVAYTNRFPRLALTGQFGIESDEFSNIIRSPMHFLNASLLGPLFGMGRRQSAYRAQQAVYEQECYAYEKVVLNAFKEVRDAIVAYNKARDIYDTMEQLENASKTNMDLAQLQYINGVIGYIDVLDAQRSYFDAQVGLSNAALYKRLAMVQLYKALGGGW